MVSHSMYSPSRPSLPRCAVSASERSSPRRSPLRSSSARRRSRGGGRSLAGAPAAHGEDGVAGACDVPGAPLPGAAPSTSMRVSRPAWRGLRGGGRAPPPPRGAASRASGARQRGAGAGASAVAASVPVLAEAERRPRRRRPRRRGARASAAAPGAPEGGRGAAGGASRMAMAVRTMPSVARRMRAALRHEPQLRPAAEWTARTAPRAAARAGPRGAAAVQSVSFCAIGVGPAARGDRPEFRAKGATSRPLVQCSSP